MLPRWHLPARSSNLGIMANTDGGYPLVAGGSPAERPISRWALAMRVMESISSITSKPWSLKYSAIAVATNGARALKSAG
jgi:hypothetical protein